MAGGQKHIHEGAMVALRSVHGKYLSAQPDGRAMWDRPWASTWEYFHVERRQNGKITLKGAHGMYLSAQLDGGVQINRGAAPPSGWEEFTVEDRGNDVVCLKSCHGKYLSAQQDGTAQWNRDHAPRGGWEDIQIEQYRKTSESILSLQTGWYRMEHADGSFIERARVHRDERKTGVTNEFIATGDLTGDVTWYVEGNKVIVPKFSSTGKIQADGNITWDRDGTKAVYEGNSGNTGQRESAAMAASMPPSVTVSGAGSSEVNGTYVFKPGKHENRHWGTIAGHYQHTQNPEIFIAFQDCGTAHQRPDWNKWMIISKIGVLYAAHTGGKIGVPPRDGGWETVDRWGNSGAPGGKHPAPTVRHGEKKVARRIEQPSEISTQGNFEFIPVSEYDEIWNDKGSGAKQDVSVWRARVPAGCHLIGMTAKNGHSPPTFSALVIRAGGSDIAPPERFDLVWWQERGQRRFWCWRPIPPPGYASLGDVGTLSEDPPSRGDVVCVALGCLGPNTQPLGGQIWNDSGGGAPKDAAFFAQPGSTGLFRCSDNTHNKPYGEFHLPATASTNGIEILEAVASKPVRFRINNRPSSNDAWVGIYPKDASDHDHGEQNKRWKWLREIDVNDASFPMQAEGSWSIRVFSNGGHTLHERKDFQVKARHVGTRPPDVAAAKSKRVSVKIAMVIGICLLIPGLPLFIGGHGPPGEEQLGMLIPGAIMMGVGGFLTFGASFFALSLWSESYAESRKSPPRWPRIATVCAVLLLIPGVALLIIGLISSGTVHHEDTTSAHLWISDADGLGDQGFIIFIEGTPGDFDSNGIHDYCEALVVNAHHSGSWMSDPWTATATWNEADTSRQAFELEIAHSGSGCSADVWPEQKGDLVKIGRACYGCMAGYTDISAYTNDFSYPIPMWIQDGEKIVESTGIWIAGSIIMGISGLSLVGLAIVRSNLRKSMAARKDPMTPTIEILAATEGKPVRFRINGPPNSRSAWVGIYPSGAEDQDHGEEGERWKWLRDIDVKRALFPEKSEGRWSMRVFSDGGFTLDERVDFDILPEKERWWED